MSLDTAVTSENAETAAIGVGQITHGKPVFSLSDLVIPVMVVLISIALYLNVQSQDLDSIEANVLNFDSLSAGDHPSTSS